MEKTNEEQKNQELESLGLYVSSIAHNFNNLLTVIILNISIAKTFIAKNHGSFNVLVRAENASVQATALVRQLMEFARGGEPVKKIISLHHLVKETVSLVLLRTNVKITIDVPDSIHAIEADEGQISQAILNIVINAQQAMPYGGALVIAARNEMYGVNNSMAIPPGTYTILTITDEGSGISTDTLGKVFSPYFTTKAEGNGLGLASTRSIISNHGGHISVSSVVDNGTIFTIYLPSIGETISEYQTESDIHASQNNRKRSHSATICN